MRVSHEAIYQALYVQGRGALRRELTVCLRTGRALRVPRARTRGRGRKFVTPEILISQRPAEAADRAVPGHWEGDLIVGLDSSAIGTLVERSTRFTMLLHLPPMEGHGTGPRVKNGPALAGHGAEAVRDAISSAIITLPAQLPAQTGVPPSRWTGPELAAELAAQHLASAPMSVSSLLRILAENPVKPWQYQSWIYPRDPDFAAKATVILDLYQGFYQGEPVRPGDRTQDTAPRASQRPRTHARMCSWAATRSPWSGSRLLS